MYISITKKCVTLTVRTRFEIPAQSVNGLRPKKPKIMNL